MLRQLKEVLRAHPQHLVLVTFILGLLLRTDTFVCVVVTAVALVALCLRVWLVVCMAAVFIVGSWLAQRRLEAIEHPAAAQMIGEQISQKAVLIEHLRTTPYGDRTAAIELVGKRLDGAKIQLTVRKDGRVADAPVGSELFIRGQLKQLKEGQQYLRNRGIVAAVVADTVRVIGKRGGLNGLVDTARISAEQKLRVGLNEPEGALLRGMVLGQDSALTPEIRDSFRATGLTHLVAASGQNILLLVGLLLPLCKLIGIRRRSRVVLLLGAIGFYVLLVGSGPSIQRAGVMGAIGCVGLLVGRKPFKWYALLIGAAVTLAINPLSYKDVGWQLSFVAVAAIFLGSRPLADLLSKALPKTIAEVVGVTLAATLGTAPLIALYFDQFSWVSLPANIAAAPAVGVVMMLGALAAVLGQLDVRLAVLINTITQFPLAYLQAVAQLGVALASTPLPLFSEGQVAKTTGPRISFLDVGQGDATLIEDGKRTVLVDTGPPGGAVLKELQESGVEKIDLMVITHPQSDHEGSAEAVLSHYQVGALLDGGYGSKTPEHRQIVDAAARKQVKRVIPTAGETFTIGDIVLDLYWPTREAVSSSIDPNDRAIVAVAKLGKFSALMTADAESNITNTLGLPTVDILKVAHHGSEDTGLPQLLAQVSPKTAVIEVGKENSYGHPSPQTLSALKTVPHIYRTDRDGTVRFKP